MPKASIIIVTYNGLRETTVPCLESIFRESGNGDYEVVVVDNNSQDGTPEYLTELAGREPRLRLVLNKTNRGFAGGNNDGIAASSGQVLVLLNNDTRVSLGWLTGLCTALEGGSSIGLVGPVSNEVGNEQKIFTCGRTPDEILAEGAAWVRHSAGDAFDTERLGFFCVALRRDVVESVGVLDETYGLGFYEDDDFCLRVKKGGYRMLCLEDIFVYHRGSGSFGSKPGEVVKKLLKRNRRLLNDKFGISYHPRHPRDRQLDLIEASLVQAEAGLGVLQRWKILNRLKLVAEMMPKGILKRFLVQRKLKKMTARLESVA